MYIIVGLGNPGREYETTRHNAGFEVVDRLADSYHIDVSNKKMRSLYGKGMIGAEKVILVKPQTYMNLSGESVRAFIDYYKIANDKLIVIYDDISLEPGYLRIRTKGSAGGHNGIKNIIAHLGVQEFSRVKVGVGEKPRGMDLANYVLSRFSKGELEKMDESYRDASDAVVMMLAQGNDAAMNYYNGKKNKETS